MYLPAEYREDHAATERAWSALWLVFRARFGLRPSARLDDKMAIALLGWSATPEGEAAYRRARWQTLNPPDPPPAYGGFGVF